MLCVYMCVCVCVCLKADICESLNVCEGVAQHALCHNNLLLQLCFYPFFAFSLSLPGVTNAAQACLPPDLAQCSILPDVGRTMAAGLQDTVRRVIMDCRRAHTQKGWPVATTPTCENMEAYFKRGVLHLKCDF
jgi:hypothetical protein